MTSVEKDGGDMRTLGHGTSLKPSHLSPPLREAGRRRRRRDVIQREALAALPFLEKHLPHICTHHAGSGELWEKGQRNGSGEWRGSGGAGGQGQGQD